MIFIRKRIVAMALRLPKHSIGHIFTGGNPQKINIIKYKNRKLKAV